MKASKSGTKSKQVKASGKKRTAADEPIPFVPVQPIDPAIEVDAATANVRTLADLGITPARAWALMQVTHESVEFDPLAPPERCCTLHTEFDFHVVLVVRDPEEFLFGNVYALQHVAEVNEHGHAVVRVSSHGIGYVRDGRFVDNIASSEQEYHERAAGKAVA